MFARRARGPVLETERLVLRLPRQGDHLAWAETRRASAAFLDPWEPLRAADHLSRRAFRERVAWAARSWASERAAPFFLIRRSDGLLLGAATLDNIRRGPAMAGTLGYWIGEAHARRGYMTEALDAIRPFAFDRLDVSRIEAACLPENTASRGLLEKVGFKYEGVAQSYLQIAGRWRTHVLYASLRLDRRGRVGGGTV